LLARSPAAAAAARSVLQPSRRCDRCAGAAYAALSQVVRQRRIEV